MVQDTVVNKYEDMLGKGEPIKQVYKSNRFIILLENLFVIILALVCLYFFSNILQVKMFIFLYETLNKDIFFSKATPLLLAFFTTLFSIPSLIGLVFYLLLPFIGDYKYILTDKKLILDFINFPVANIIYYDNIQKIELINKKIEEKYNLSTIKIFLKSSKIKNKFVVIPAVKNPNEFVANLEKMINGGKL